MGTQRICAIPDCGKLHRARGLCTTHWKQWRKDASPDDLLIPAFGLLVQFLDTSYATETSECIEWPFGRCGSGRDYGSLKIDGKVCKPHRVICERRHGPPPVDKPLACHKCGNSLCVNPAHIEWGSHADNSADAIRHGTTPKGSKNANAKLTDDQAKTIFLSIESHGKLAARHGVTRTAVQQIQAGATWQHATAGLIAPTGRLIPGSRRTG